MEIIGLIILWGGVIFCGIGVFGIVRFPDVYNRLHASGVVSTLGLGGILLGAALMMPSIVLRVVALAIFLLVSAPAATHAVALAARRVAEANPKRSVPSQNTAEAPQSS